MPTRFATGLDRPVLAAGYPLSLTVAISPSARQQLYFERVYRSAAGNQLAIRATLIEARGLVHLLELGPLPVGTAYIEASVRSENRATEADPVPVAQEPVTQPIRFATDMEVPVLREGSPLHLAVGIAASGSQQVVYLERVYQDSQRRQIAIRSDVVLDRNTLAGFNIHVPEPPPGTRYINVSITNQYRATEEAQTLEYESLEYNDLEYN